MAGIGFQLKELYDQSNFLGQIRAMSFSAIVATGPMFLTILLITVVREWLLVLGTPQGEVLLFMSTTQYAFIFSQLLTGGFLFIISCCKEGVNSFCSQVRPTNIPIRATKTLTACTIFISLTSC